jgi:hypothetical protein
LLLAELFDGVGLSIAEREGTLIAAGVALKSQDPFSLATTKLVVVA